MTRIWRLLVGCASALAAVLAASVCAAATPCSYRDYMPDYARFLASTKGVAPEARARNFLKLYAAAHPDFYWPQVFGDAAKQKKRAILYFDPQHRPQFPGFPALTDARVLALAGTVGPQFLIEQKRFVQTFPDFSCDTTVEFAPSLMTFDGHPDTFGGKKYLLFGVDLIAMVHRPADMPAFFDHELFHLYHHQVLKGLEPKGDDPCWWSMWVEGLATYVSQRMNPELDAQHVLWFPSDMVARMKTEAPRGARLVLADIDKTGGDADRWFSAGQSVAGLPERAGYYYGYLFANSIGAGTPLPALARMKPDDVHVREKAFLKRLAGS